jgi:alkanesulfonate monooxygenase SsuD/methylene tetrahydromethanopterin reductase-like flavin-dependent oxidoreductase (luciferase family)
VRIGVRLSLRDTAEIFADARAIEAAGADSVWVDAHDADPYVLLAALAAVTWRVRLVASGAPGGIGRETCDALARGRLVVAEGSTEKWTHASFPESKRAWREQRAAAAAAGLTGITIPNDPRLIDLLRNPDIEDDRSDLDVAVG